MRKYLLILTILFLLTLPVSAQGEPEIISFSYDGIPLTYDLVEQGVAEADFTWQAINVTVPYRMQMHAFVGGQWALIGEDFDPAKSDRLVIAHPLSFSMPSYRLSIVDAAGQIVDEAHLRLTYADSDPDGATHLIDFQTEETEISRQALINGTAFLNVSWNVLNRTTSTNIVFEQVLPDGTWQAIELPRLENWVRSVGTGVVAPINVAGEDEIRIQARVLDVVTGDSMGAIQLLIPIDNDVVRAEPTAVPTEPTITLNDQIIFDTPYIAALGSSLTISWDATAIASVADEVIIREWHRIEFTGRYGLQPVYIDNVSNTPVNEWTGLALSGQITVDTPAEFPESGVSYRDFQNVVMYALYLSKDGEEITYEGASDARFNVQRGVFLRTMQQATDCEPTLTIPGEAIAGEPLQVSWDFCGAPYVSFSALQNGNHIYDMFFTSLPGASSGSNDFTALLFDGEESAEMTIIAENVEMDYHLEAVVRIVRE